jgi:protein-disulfide isomerase
MRQDTLMNAAVGILVICAVVVTGTVIDNRLGQRTSQVEEQPTEVPDWEQYAATGHRMGSANAPVIITEFSDFQCPFCRRMYDMLKQAEAANPERVAVVYRHYPLAMHHNAMPAAIAAECAAEQGRFAAMHDLLFEQQDSLGVKSWQAFAADAGVPDSARFTHCLASEAPRSVIARDTAAGNALHVTGTPTLIINDRKVPAVRDAAQLESYIDDAVKMKGRVALAARR